jgi:hypothetical protein
MKSLIPLLAALSGLALPGCFVGVDHDHGGAYADDALFTVEWSIDGSTDPDACLDFDAAYAYVTVESRYGTEADQTVPCERFSYDFYLPPGRYWVTVALQDRDRRDVTSVIETDSYSLAEGDSNYVVADFPPDSFQ